MAVYAPVTALHAGGASEPSDVDLDRLVAACVYVDSEHQPFARQIPALVDAIRELRRQAAR